MFKLDVEHPAVRNAAIWIRDTNQIPDHESIKGLFENEFKCNVRVSKRSGFANSIVFNRSKDLDWFVLKWS